MRSAAFFRSVFFAAAFVIVGSEACSSTSSTKRAGACAPRETKQCLTTTGCSGVQTCKDDGNGFDTCQCIDGGAGTRGAGGSSAGASGSDGAGGSVGASGSKGGAGVNGAGGANGSGGGSGNGGAAGGGGAGAGMGVGGTAGSGGALGKGGAGGGPTDAGCDMAGCAANIPRYCRAEFACHCQNCACLIQNCAQDPLCHQMMMCVNNNVTCNGVQICAMMGAPCSSVWQTLSAASQSLALTLDACIRDPQKCPNGC